MKKQRIRLRPSDVVVSLPEMRIVHLVLTGELERGGSIKIDRRGEVYLGASEVPTSMGALAEDGAGRGREE